MIIIAQLIGILAMASNIMSFQFKSKNHIIFFQFLGSLLFAINMFMINAFMGGLLNVIGVIRSVIYVNKDKIKRIQLVNLCFLAVYILSYILVFTAFGKALTLFNVIIELLPVVGMSVMTLALSANNTKAIRLAGFINSPCWLAYNIANMAVGGIICEVINIISVTVAYLRFDKNKGELS